MMTHILMPATSSSTLIAAVPSLPSPVVLAYIAAAILFILAAAGLSRHETAAAGKEAGGAGLGSDVGGDALERHDGDGSSVLGDTGLLGRDDVHDDASLEHVRHAAFDGEGAGAGSGLLCTQSWSSGREPRPPHGAAATSPRKC